MDTPRKQTSVKDRKHERIACYNAGELVIGGQSNSIQVLDISSGGCKVKIPDPTALGMVISALPVEFILTAGAETVSGAFCWYMSDMFGCNFFEHILLDTIADIRTGSFRMKLLMAKPTHV